MDFATYTPGTLLQHLEYTGENRRWEFKSKGILSNNFKQEIAREVSAFANSGGGKIVLGIKESSIDVKVEGQAKKQRKYSYEIEGWPESWGNQKMVDYLNGIVSTCVDPHLHEFEVYRIASTSTEEEPIFVVDIGDSVHAPHQVNVNDQFRYYFRSGDKSKEAPHFYLEALRNRVTKALLCIEEIDLTASKVKVLDGSMCRVRLELTIEVLNSSMQSANPWGIHFQSGNSRWRTIDKRAGRYRPRVCAHGNGILLPDDVGTVTCEVEANVSVTGKDIFSQFLGTELYDRWKTMELRLRPVSHNCIGPEVLYPSEDREIAEKQFERFQAEIQQRVRTEIGNYHR